MYPPISMTEVAARDEAVVWLLAGIRLIGHGGRDDVGAAMVLIERGLKFLAHARQRAA